MKKVITLKEAVILAQAGDSDAMIVLLKKYQPLIAKAIGKSIAKGIETDDLDSIFTLKMLTMIQKIDVSKLK